MDEENILGVWDTPDGGFFVQVSRANIAVLRRQPVGGGAELMQGVEKMGMAGEDFGDGGNGQENSGEVLCGVGARGASIWFQDSGNDPQVGEIPREFSPPGSASDGGHGPQMPTGWDMGVYTHWGGAVNGRAG